MARTAIPGEVLEQLRTHIKRGLSLTDKDTIEPSQSSLSARFGSSVQILPTEFPRNLGFCARFWGMVSSKQNSKDRPVRVMQVVIKADTIIFRLP